MPAKICIALALAVLLGALASGNPFLPQPQPAPRPEPVALPAAVAAHASMQPVPVRLVSLRADSASATAPVLPPCPDPGLQPLVSEVRFDAAGEPTWILRDGRVLHAPTARAGH